MFLNQVYWVLFSVRKCHATFTIVEYLSEALYLLQDLVTCIFFPFALKAYFILETQIIDFYHRFSQDWRLSGDD